MFQKVLVANRGEIALRIIQACHKLSLKTVAVFSTADRDAQFVEVADETICIGPAPAGESYLNREAILMAGIITGCDAIHPGYGFLSEDAIFAEMVSETEMTWIGPSAKLIQQFADKEVSRQWAKKRDVPIILGSDNISSIDQLKTAARQIGYPVLLKASLGGGGKGIRKAANQTELLQEFQTIQSEVAVSFATSDFYLEQDLKNAQHIEVQVLGVDNQIYILGDRNCSLQLHHQKVIEESPAMLAKEQRKTLYEMVHRLLDNSGYQSLGTVEFLLSEGQFYFLEMNTRLQVEHGVTELTTDCDIVQCQILAAASENFDLPAVINKNHAIEVRLTAKTPGQITRLQWPDGVRIDSGVRVNEQVTSFYDPLISKIIVSATNRAATVKKLTEALNQVEVAGIETNLSELQQIIQTNWFQDNQYDIHSLEKLFEDEQV